MLISELSRRHGVTMLQLSASLFNFLVDEHPEAFATVTVAFTGGEAASPAHVHKLQRLRPGLEVVNGYGPAESMGFTTTHPVEAADRPHPVIPIGTPLVNKGGYVLDAHLNLCPPGVTGELYLAGEGLAHGYLGRPDLTATRFVPNPFEPGRLYRTGDLARFDRNGDLLYEGRADDQIKIRGFRVEPGETEAALLTHPRVTQAVVTVHHDRLAAYVVTDDDVHPEEIRKHVADRLPEHLVPAHVIGLERLPLTPNGKIDKRALPEPAVTAASGRAPRTPLEETLLALFVRVLDTTASLTIDDDFFHHGGHSLLAARLTNHIADALGVRLTIRDVFGSPTPAGLAELVAGRKAYGMSSRRWSRGKDRKGTDCPGVVRAAAPVAPFAARRGQRRLQRADGGALRGRRAGPGRAGSGAGGRGGAACSAADGLRDRGRRTAPADPPAGAGTRARGITPDPDRSARSGADRRGGPGVRPGCGGSGAGGGVRPRRRACGPAAGGAPHRDRRRVEWCVLRGSGAGVRGPGRGAERSALEPLTVQYADYAVWQRRVLGSADDPDGVLGRDLGFGAARWRAFRRSTG